MSTRLVTVLLATLAAALPLALPAGAAAADCPGADLEPAAQGLPAAGAAAVCLVNAERAAQGLRPLALQAQLGDASQRYSDLMVARRFFAHETPDGVGLVDRLTASGYVRSDLETWLVGENLAWGEGDLATPRAIVRAWMASPGHRANILNREYVEIGVGVAAGTPVAGPSGATYTTDFGMRVAQPPVRHAAVRRTTAAQRRAAARARAAKARAARARAAKARAARARAARAAAARGRR
jgi:uncharacterized protein YkwD